MSDVSPATPSENEEYLVVAEDSAPNRNILVLLLKKLGFKVIECEDGDVAWKYLQENKNQNIVGILSDIMMPQMDGMELLRRVRVDDKWKTTPFILVTAVSDKEYIFEAKTLKVDGYILKPVTFKRVEAKMKEVFPNRIFPVLSA